MRGTLLLLSLLCAAPVMAQDSVSRLPGLPGDAVVPWFDSTFPAGSEQCDAYAVTLADITTSWGNTFGIAPVVKSSKTTLGFFSSLPSAQAISKKIATGVPAASPAYRFWRGPGFGVNNNPNVSRVGQLFNVPPALLTNQIGLAFAEFATTDLMAEYNGIIGALINYAPQNPRVLGVTRYVAAINSCENASNLSQLAIGGVDEAGNIIFRADDFAITGGCPPLVPLIGNNIFLVNMANRDCDFVNVMTNDYPAGQFDAGATSWILQNSGTTHNVPNLVPASVAGGVPIYIGSNFNTEYVRGTSAATLKSDLSHLAPTMLDHRGNVSYTSRNCAFLGSTHGTAALLARDSNDLATVMNVWGLDSNADVTGILALQLPAVITDNSNGVTNIAGINEFDHYHSQVAFRGGNGQVAMNTDQQGNLLVAAVADHPDDGGPAWELNYVAVARVDCNTGSTDWTLAGYTTNTGGITGKPILDGAGGATIGQMTPYCNVPPGVFIGPSMSAPMIDSVGNVYFLASIELFAPISIFTVGLLRAVYEPTTFSYELELVFAMGDEITGVDSQTPYIVDFMPVADSNSIDSASTWSGNIVEDAHLGQDPALLSPSDPETLGGMIVHAEIIYDVNGDGLYEDPTDPMGNPNSPDQAYNVILYLGAVTP